MEGGVSIGGEKELPMAGNGSNSKCILDRERERNGWRSLIQNVKGRKGFEVKV